MSRPNVALIELYDSHDELLFSQALFLQRSGIQTLLIVSERHRAFAASFGFGQEVIPTYCSGKKGPALWKELWRIRKIILDMGVKVLIFNTAHSNPVRNFSLLSFPADVRFFGTLHGVNKLEGSLTQSLISRKIKHYFLLNDYMLEKALRIANRALKFSVYYPLFQPAFQVKELVARKPGELWVCIPGLVEYKRRDYPSLVEALSGLAKKPAVRFIILGNGTHAHGNGAELQKLVQERNLEDYFLFFDGFVDHDQFHSYLQASDVVMPLTHPINAELMKYAEDQITGSFNLAFGYRKPLLMHEYYKRYPDFQENALFYSLEGLGTFLENLEQNLQEEHAFYQNPKWGLDFQTKNYVGFLGVENLVGG